MACAGAVDPRVAEQRALVAAHHLVRTPASPARSQVKSARPAGDLWADRHDHHASQIAGLLDRAASRPSCARWPRAARNPPRSRTAPCSEPSEARCPTGHPSARTSDRRRTSCAARRCGRPAGAGVRRGGAPSGPGAGCFVLLACNVMHFALPSARYLYRARARQSRRISRRGRDAIPAAPRIAFIIVCPSTAQPPSRRSQREVPPPRERPHAR